MGSNPAYMTIFNSKLYFSASNGVTGRELWVYDGINTPSIVADIWEGYDGSDPGNRRPVAIDNLGVAKLTCSKCGKETVIK